MARSPLSLVLSMLFAFVLLGCGGSSGDDSDTGEDAVGEVETTTTEAATTTAAPTTTEATTTEAPATTEATTTAAPTTVAAVADDAAVIAYCTAHDDVDAFLDADFPAEDQLAAAVDGQQELLASMVPPAESIQTAHESYAGALLEFYDTFEANGYDISDEDFAEIFSALDVRLGERIIEQYRVTNCDGYEGTPDSESEIVSGSFSFETGQCINQSASGDFDEVDCGEGHDYQVYSTFDVTDGDFPGEDALIVEAEASCLEAFEPFIGASFAESIYYVTTLRPTAGSWTFGDREIVCLAQAEVGQLTKDIEGSGE